MAEPAGTGDQLADLRAALGAELSKESPDYEQVAALSNALIEAVPGQTRFSVDAGLVARLGQQLVAKHDTALAELVKNAYDADATSVQVHVARAGAGNFIEITDDGSGMTRQSLVNDFMRLATDAKVEQPHSPVFGRRRAGRKGVGRFAAERLGRRLILTTAAQSAERALQLKIEWGQFAAGKNLTSIVIPIEEVEKEFQGTKLRIEELRDPWPPSVVEKAFRYIINLIDPGDLTQSSRDTSDFDVTFFADGQRTTVVDARSQIGQYAFASVEAKIDDDGTVTWGMQCRRLKIDISDRPLRLGPKETSKLEHARNARLRTHYFIIDRLNIPSTAFSTVQGYLSVHGGLRLYRNGFRVPPYGDVGDDWLGLDQLSSRRLTGETGTLAPIRNRNFLGSVSIDDEDGLFEETSSREGLIQTPAVTEMQTAFSSVLVTAVREIDATRARLNLKRPAPPTPRAPTPTPSLTPTPTVTPASGTAGEDAARDLESALSAAAGKLTVAGATSKTAAETINQLATKAATVADIARERDALVREIDLLRVLASMGLAIGQFTHEFSTLSGAIRADVAILLEQGRTNEEKKHAAEAVRALVDQARSFSGLFKSMTEQNALRDRQPIDLYEATTSFVTSIRSILRRNSVAVDVSDDGEQVFSPPMHRSELYALLLNFTTNSIKAAKRAGRPGKINVRLSHGDERSTVIEFMDNGDGIAPEVRDTLFDPFVTTTAVNPTVDTDEELALGSGLGLTIVRDIVTATGGTVITTEAPEPYTTCMRVVFPNQERAL